MDGTIITGAVTQVLTNVALGVISLLAAYALHYISVGATKLREQTAKIVDEHERTLLDNALNDVEKIAYKTVAATEQTTARQLRQAVKDGKVDRAELLRLGEQARWDVTKAISPDAQELITDNLGSFDAYVSKCVEEAVLKLKPTSVSYNIDAGDMGLTLAENTTDGDSNATVVSEPPATVQN